MREIAIAIICIAGALIALKMHLGFNAENELSVCAAEIVEGIE